eukprot:scaffold220943_cov17-Tisochrysis_lutea.AAC.1
MDVHQSHPPKSSQCINFLIPHLNEEKTGSFTLCPAPFVQPCQGPPGSLGFWNGYQRSQRTRLQWHQKWMSRITEVAFEIVSRWMPGSHPLKARNRLLPTFASTLRALLIAYRPHPAVLVVLLQSQSSFSKPFSSQCALRRSPQTSLLRKLTLLTGKPIQEASPVREASASVAPQNRGSSRAAAVPSKRKQPSPSSPAPGTSAVCASLQASKLARTTSGSSRAVKETSAVAIKVAADTEAASTDAGDREARDANEAAGAEAAQKASSRRGKAT